MASDAQGEVEVEMDVVGAERTLLVVMEAFIAANRALLNGVDEAIASAREIPPHACSGADCVVHKAALSSLEEALDDNARLGQFISEVLGRTERRV